MQFVSGFWPVAERAEQRIAIETPAASLSYRELASRSRAAARELGVKPRERVAIALAPGIEFTVALHACFAAGAVAVPIDLREPRECWPPSAVTIDRPLTDSGPELRPAALDLDDVAAVIRTSGKPSLL